MRKWLATYLGWGPRPRTFFDIVRDPSSKFEELEQAMAYYRVSFRTLLDEDYTTISLICNLDRIDFLEILFRRDPTLLSLIGAGAHPMSVACAGLSTHCLGFLTYLTEIKALDVPHDVFFSAMHVFNIYASKNQKKEFVRELVKRVSSSLAPTSKHIRIEINKKMLFINRLTRISKYEGADDIVDESTKLLGSRAPHEVCLALQDSETIRKNFISVYRRLLDGRLDLNSYRPGFIAYLHLRPDLLDDDVRDIHSPPELMVPDPADAASAVAIPSSSVRLREHSKDEVLKPAVAAAP